MSLLQSGLSALGKVSVIIVLLGAFLFGLGGTLLMALRSPEVKVPQIVGKDFADAEKELKGLGLKIRKRSDRFSQEKPNTVLEQTPLAGDTVKGGQIIAVVIARAESEEGEKPAEVKKETVNDNANKAVDEPSEVEKSRQKRKQANANKNANGNKNKNSNNSNSGDNSNSNNSASNSSGNSNSGSTNSGNTRTNANSGNSNSRPANANSRPANSNSSNRSANSNGRSTNSNRGGENNRRNQ